MTACGLQYYGFLLHSGSKFIYWKMQKINAYPRIKKDIIDLSSRLPYANP